MSTWFWLSVLIVAVAYQVVSMLVRYAAERYHLKERARVERLRDQAREEKDEAVLLGPVSAWVAEGEARAVREWEEKATVVVRTPPAPTGADWTYKGWLKGCPCLDCEWVDVRVLHGGGSQWVLGRQCAKHAPRDPDLPWPMREAERR